jgi:hypothetical protein
MLIYLKIIFNYFIITNNNIFIYITGQKLIYFTNICKISYTYQVPEYMKNRVEMCYISDT